MSDDRHRSPSHYRAQAEKLRKMAEAEHSIDIREKLMQVARDYERLAEMRERTENR